MMLRLDDFQLDLYVRERFGSSRAWDVDGYSVSFLEGEWRCTCEGFQKKYIKRSDYCRHIWKKKCELKDDYIRLLQGQIKELMEKTTRHRKRGLGAHYGIEKLGDVHRTILQMLSELGDGEHFKWGVPRRYIRVNLHKKYGFTGTDTAIGERISRLLGGFVCPDRSMVPLLEMSTTHRVAVDAEGEFRFVEKGGTRKPMYRLSEAGWRVVRNDYKTDGLFMAKIE